MSQEKIVINMGQINFFDCNVILGRLTIPHGEVFETAESLRAELDRLRIQEAIVHHTIEAENSPVVGNRLLLEAIDAVEGLQPQWVVMPHHTEEMPRPKELIEDLKKNNVRTVRVFPGPDKYRFRLKEIESGELLGALNDVRMPLFVDHPLVDWSTIEWLLKNYPAMPLVITTISYRVTRNIYPLMKHYNSLYIETSRFLSHRGIEDFVERFGPIKLLFSTKMPYNAGGGPVSQLTYAEISDEDMALIAGGNLRKLLGDIRW